MKLITHDVFSFGLCEFITLHLGFSPLSSVILSGWLSLSINWIIDALGHRPGDNHPRRTFMTHSVFLAPLWGGMVGVIYAVLASAALQVPIGTIFAVSTALLGGVVALSHLFLDAFTEGGVYWWTRRVAIAHIHYDSPALNLVFVLLGLLFIVALLMGH